MKILILLLFFLFLHCLLKIVEFYSSNLMKRLFIAAKMEFSPETLQVANKIKRQLAGEDVVWVENGIQHLTLRFLGKTPDSQIEPLCQAMTELCGRTPAFELSLDKLGVFGSHYAPSVLWMGFENFAPLIPLFQKTESVVTRLGFEGNYGNFVPHITLGRIKHLNSKKLFWKIFQENEHAVSQLISIKEFVLFRSQLEHAGPIYTELKTFPLQSNL